LRVTVTVSKIVKNENQQIKNRRAHLRVTVARIYALPYQKSSKMKITKSKIVARVTVARICTRYRRAHLRALPSRAFAQECSKPI
jgi:hypothetical protein